MKKFFALVFLFAAIPALSFSQERMGEYWVMPLKDANLANFDFDLANSDLAGEVVGCIKSESGKPIVGAVVVILGGLGSIWAVIILYILISLARMIVGGCKAKK